MFVAKALSDGSTVYRSRVTGTRYTITPAWGSSVFWYINGIRQPTAFRREALSKIVQADETFQLVKR
jgi:hypothetical protein